MPLLRALLSSRLPSVYEPRHAKPSRVAPVLVAGGMTTALAVGDAGVLAGAASAAAPDASWDRLARCESGGNWAINTGNGYYGGLQFNLGTWNSVGGSGLPSNAGRAEQIRRANLLHDARGFAPWPACSRKLGLRGGGSGATLGAAARSVRLERASRSRRVAASAAAVRTRVARTAVATPPPYAGLVLSTAAGGAYSAAVAQWQGRMAARGWRISVDGRFGPQTAGVASRFAAQKGLAPARPGTVDRAVWEAAWRLPVS